MDEDVKMWELYVPCVRNNGRPIRTRCHREWDSRVRRISGGLTIYPPVRGQWISPATSNLFVERMIPVRIACTREQIKKIIDMTIDFYDQEAVLCTKISEEVILKYKKEPLPF